MTHYICKPSCGYYSFGRKKVYVDSRLSRQPFAQAGTDYFKAKDKNGNDIYGRRLISYTTAVLFLDNNDILHISGTYSRSTIRHISSFLREFCYPISYQTVKDAYALNRAIDVLTGLLVTDELDQDSWSNVLYENVED